MRERERGKTPGQGRRLGGRDGCSDGQVIHRHLSSVTAVRGILDASGRRKIDFVDSGPVKDFQRRGSRRERELPYRW